MESWGQVGTCYLLASPASLAGGLAFALAVVGEKGSLVGKAVVVSREREREQRCKKPCPVGVV